MDLNYVPGGSTEHPIKLLSTTQYILVYDDFLTAGLCSGGCKLTGSSRNSVRGVGWYR